MGVDAARRAVRLAPNNGRAQLTLSQALARTGDARGAFQAAALATELLPDDAGAREALADAHWLADQDAAAFAEFRALHDELAGADRGRVVRKARTLYRQHAGWGGRLVSASGWPRRWPRPCAIARPMRWP
jgi:Flp pilus assembly protein TadD